MRKKDFATHYSRTMTGLNLNFFVFLPFISCSLGITIK